MARLNTQPLIAGSAVGALMAVAIVLLPSTAIESLIARTNLAEVMTAAQPPLGTKARLLLSLIPLVLFTAIGVVLGLVLGKRKRGDDYSDYGAYADYSMHDQPVGDPFAPEELQADGFVTPAAVPSEPVFETTPAAPPPVAPPAAPPPAPAPVAEAAPALDTATARDLAEIADAVVRLDARLDTIEAKLGSGAGAAAPADLQKRLAKIAKSLDDAG